MAFIVPEFRFPHAFRQKSMLCAVEVFLNRWRTSRLQVMIVGWMEQGVVTTKIINKLLLLLKIYITVELHFLGRSAA
jgi:hypothetical protein